jgi:flagellar biosynthetic protein FliR
MLEAVLVERFLTFVLVLGRIGGVVATAPLFGATGIPRRVRALVALALALLVSPAQHPVSAGIVQNVFELARLLASEVLLGLLLGLGLNILLTGILVAGQVVTQMSGMSLADVFSPGFDESVSVFSQFFYFLALTVFVAIGGHRMVLEALLDTFAWLPPGGARVGESYVEAVVAIVTRSFHLGLRAVAPVMTALLLSTIVLGLVGRTLPQLNIIIIGFNINALLTLGVLLVGMGAIAWTFPDQAADVLTETVDLIRAAH